MVGRYAFAALMVAGLARGSEVVPFYMGVIYNVLLSYFVFRGLLKSWPDVIEFLSLLGLLIVPMALSMLYESATGYNVFRISVEYQLHRSCEKVVSGVREHSEFPSPLACLAPHLCRFLWGCIWPAFTARAPWRASFPGWSSRSLRALAAP